MERDHGVFFVGVVIGIVLFSNYMSDHHPQMMAEINPAKERVVILNGLQYSLEITHLQKTDILPPGKKPWIKRVPLGQIITVNVLRDGEAIGTTYFRVPDHYQDDLCWHVISFTPRK